MGADNQLIQLWLVQTLQICSTFTQDTLNQQHILLSLLLSQFQELVSVHDASHLYQRHCVDRIQALVTHEFFKLAQESCRNTAFDIVTLMKLQQVGKGLHEQLRIHY